MDIIAPTFLLSAFLWAVILVGLVIVTAFTENNSPGKATLTFIGLMAVLQIFSPIKPMDMLMNSPLTFFGLVLVYMAIGVGYGVLKWFSYVRKQRDLFLAARTEYRAKRFDPNAEMDARDLAAMDKWVLSKLNLKAEDIPPQVARNKARFSAWMMYWPMSAAWTVLNDPIRRAFDAVYEEIADRLQAISNRLFAGIELNR